MKFNRFIRITKQFKFEAAHRLFDLDYDSPCKHNHGHSYKVKLSLTVNDLDQNDMVIDFGMLKPFQKWLDDNFDHATIISQNDKKYLEAIKLLGGKYFVMKYNKTTAENMAEYFNHKVIEMFQDKLEITQSIVEVFETAKNSATSSIIVKYTRL